MVEMDSLTIMAEKVSVLLDAEMEMDSGVYKLKKKRTIEEYKSSDVCVSWSLELSMALKLSYYGAPTNEAEVFLLPEELPKFVTALIQHPVLLPTNFSQQVSMERGMYCVRLMSQESPEDFAERLSEALDALN